MALICIWVSLLVRYGQSMHSCHALLQWLVLRLNNVDRFLFTSRNWT
jgi:hypothetical protein